MISGIFIILMMVAFFGIVYWAYSDKRKAEFEHMSNLPLDDFEQADVVQTETKGDENGNV
jgi:cytochrome c oxidase cbb3-type subunit 4